MTTILILIHVVVAVFLILVVMLQAGKGADLAGAFGGMGSQTAFGSRGTATLLSKLTTISAIVFMLTSLGLSIVSLQKKSIIGDEVEEAIPPAAESTIPLEEQSGPLAAGVDEGEEKAVEEGASGAALTEEETPQTENSGGDAPAETNE